MTGSLQDLGIKADYQALVRQIAPLDAVIKYYYAVSTPQTPSENNFIKYLETINFQVVKSYKKPLADGSHKIKGDDVQIATDMANDASPNDKIILVSGDGDFEYAITQLKKLKACQITVISTSSNLSHNLKKAADSFIDIKDLKNIIRRQSKQKSKSQHIISPSKQLKTA